MLVDLTNSEYQLILRIRDKGESINLIDNYVLQNIDKWIFLKNVPNIELNSDFNNYCKLNKIKSSSHKLNNSIKSYCLKNSIDFISDKAIKVNSICTKHRVFIKI